GAAAQQVDRAEGAARVVRAHGADRRRVLDDHAVRAAADRCVRRHAEPEWRRRQPVPPDRAGGPAPSPHPPETPPPPPALPTPRSAVHSARGVSRAGAGAPVSPLPDRFAAAPGWDVPTVGRLSFLVYVVAAALAALVYREPRSHAHLDAPRRGLHKSKRVVYRL